MANTAAISNIRDVSKAAPFLLQSSMDFRAIYSHYFLKKNIFEGNYRYTSINYIYSVIFHYLCLTLIKSGKGSKNKLKRNKKEKLTIKSLRMSVCNVNKIFNSLFVMHYIRNNLSPFQFNIII